MDETRVVGRKFSRSFLFTSLKGVGEPKLFCLKYFSVSASLSGLCQSGDPHLGEWSEV